MQNGIVVMGMAANGRDAVEQIADHPPDIALIDIAMPALNGIEATRQICKRCPTVRVIIISIHTAQEYILSAIQAGARGYIVKEFVEEESIFALQTVYVGKIFVSNQFVSDQMALLSIATVCPDVII